MMAFRVAFAALALAGLAACAPQSAYQAVDDLGMTAGQAGQAAHQAGHEAQAMGSIANEVRMDVRDIKEIERWFDQQRRISFD